MTWKYWTPERDGHAPDDWDGVNVECICRSNQRVDVSACPVWFKGTQYRYRPLQDAKYEPDWIEWVPEYDGHAPSDWDSERHVFKPLWFKGVEYRYYPKQPDLLAQCLALPQADREALIEALQKPQRDWADDVAARAIKAYGLLGDAPEMKEVAAVIRSLCRPKEEN